MFLNNPFVARGRLRTIRIGIRFLTISLGFLVFFLISRPAACRSAVSLPFEGQVDFKQKKFIIKILNLKRPMTLTAWVQEDDFIGFTLNVDDQKTLIGHISTFLEGRFQFLDGFVVDRTGIIGTIQGRHTFINNEPCGDFEAQWHVTKDRLIIRSLLSRGLSAEGQIRTTPPYVLDLALNLKNLDINPVLNAVQDAGIRTSFGPFEGRLRITGSTDRIEIKGRLLTFNGTIEGLDYQDMLLNFEGVYPWVQIENSHIIQPDGTIFKIAGNLDLSRMTEFDKQVRRFMSKPLIQHDGQDLEWTLKRLHQNGSDTTSELKYLYRKEQGDHPALPQEGVIFGLERRLRF